MTIAWNQSLFLWINHACAALPDWLWASLTITGHTSVIFALFAPLLLRQSKIITALLIAAVLGGVVSTTMKEVLQILRPPAVLSADQFHLIGDKLELVSFPSGHSLAAFTAATLLIMGLRLRGWKVAGVLWVACLVGLSRIAVGAHWPLDVLGGAALGVICGWIGWRTTTIIDKRWLWPQNVIYLSCQSVIILIVSASLFIIAMGYPQAMAWQQIIGVFGVICAVFSLYTHLKSVKIQENDD